MELFHVGKFGIFGSRTRAVFRAGTNNRVNSAPLCIEACDPGITGTYSGEGAAFCMKYETGKYNISIGANSLRSR